MLRFTANSVICLVWEVNYSLRGEVEGKTTFYWRDLWARFPIGKMIIFNFFYSTYVASVIVLSYFTCTLSEFGRLVFRMILTYNLLPFELLLQEGRVKYNFYAHV